MVQVTLCDNICNFPNNFPCVITQGRCFDVLVKMRQSSGKYKTRIGKCSGVRNITNVSALQSGHRSSFRGAPPPSLSLQMVWKGFSMRGWAFPTIPFDNGEVR